MSGRHFKKIVNSMISDYHQLWIYLLQELHFSHSMVTGGTDWFIMRDDHGKYGSLNVA